MQPAWLSVGVPGCQKLQMMASPGLAQDVAIIMATVGVKVLSYFVSREGGGCP